MRTAGQGPGGFEKRDGFIKPGQDLVVAGYAGMAGARLIFQKKKEKLEGRFAPSFLRCLEKEDSYNVKEWLENELKQKDCPVTAWEYAKEGGILTAVCDRGGQRVRSLSARGIPAAVIGSAEKGIARVIRHGEETAGYLERPRADELTRIG